MYIHTCIERERERERHRERGRALKMPKRCKAIPDPKAP